MPRLNSIYHSVSNTPGTSGAFTVGSAVDATWGVPPAGADGKTYRLRVSETGLGTEILQSTYTHSGTSWSRGTLESASRINFTSAAKVAVVETAADFDRFDRILRGVTPGGRLTLESGVPVSTTDQTAKTSIFYTPYLHDQIVLWDGTDWAPITFTEYTLALGTLTSGRPYDVFAYLSGGALAIEVLAWTNGTTRATAVTLQDGRYCKSGDKTRLLLGSFYTASATTTEDSIAKRFVWNQYNRRNRGLWMQNLTSHTYLGSARNWGGTTTTVEYLIGQLEDAWQFSIDGGTQQGSGSSPAIATFSLDGTDFPDRMWNRSDNRNVYAQGGMGRTMKMTSSLFKLGYHIVTLREQAATTSTFDEVTFTAGIWG